MSTGVIFILDKGVSPILASGVRSTLAPGVIRAWVFQKAYGTRICRLESCEGSDVSGASSQGVEANRCVAFSHSRGAVGWCQ